MASINTAISFRIAAWWFLKDAIFSRVQTRSGKRLFLGVVYFPMAITNKPSYALLFTVALVMKFSASCLGAPKHDFQPAKLLDVATDTKLVDGTSVRHAIFVIQIDDVIYTTRGDRLGRIKNSLLTMAITTSGDDGHDLIVGDPVQVFLHGDDLLIRKPNGKELKTKIVKKTRAR